MKNIVLFVFYFTFGFIAFILLMASGILFGFTDVVARVEASRADKGVNSGNIPAQYLPAVMEAGAICKGITPSLIAAQIEIESGWNPNAHNSSGAEGIAQFMPATFAKYTPDKDKTPYDADASIVAMGKYDCALLDHAKGKQLRNDTNAADLALAAYNTGSFTNNEGLKYAEKVLELAESKYSNNTQLVPGNAGTVINEAKKALGTAYVFGGSCTAPHYECDCSSLVQMAYRSIGVSLKRTTQEQFGQGTAVSGIGDLQPGDLIFSNGLDGSLRNPGHVSMYIGGNQVIEAPHTGSNVRITDIKEYNGGVNTIVGIRRIINNGG